MRKPWVKPYFLLPVKWAQLQYCLVELRWLSEILYRVHCIFCLKPGKGFINDSYYCCCSLTNLCLHSLQPHGLQPAKLPCPSLSPRVCSDSCPSSHWCHPTILSSVVPFSSCLQSFLASRFFQWVSSSHQVAKGLEFQLQHQSFQWIFRSDFLYDGLVRSPCSPRDSQESSPTPQSKSISSSVLSFLYSPTLTSIHDYWKKHSFD